MQLNGHTVTLTQPLTLQQLLQQQGFDPARVAVELNGVIVSRSKFDSMLISDDAATTIEVLQFVGGG